jgi:hypothetical protein
MASQQSTATAGSSAGRSALTRGLREVGHGGDVQGFANVLYAIPEKKFAVVVLSNGEKENASIEYISLARKIYDVVTAHSQFRVWVPFRDFAVKQRCGKSPELLRRCCDCFECQRARSRP